MGSKLKSMLYRSKWLLVVGLGLALGLLGVMNITGLYVPTVKPTKTVEFAKTAIMITRMDGRSGGSGVILRSNRSETKILTNKHVCQVVKNGGIVRTTEKTAMVKYYQESQIHDLCLITVNANFKVNTVVAQNAPDLYDDAIVSGFPRLLPNIVNYGHFSSYEIISVMVGMRDCTDEEWKDESTGFACFLFGGMPVIQQYEAQVVSNTIQPGSSGSAVFNKNGEISGLVFAGSGDFGYGHIVPLEYISTFLELELPDAKKLVPSAGNKKAEVMDAGLREKCTGMALFDGKVREICTLINRNLEL